MGDKKNNTGDEIAMATEAQMIYANLKDTTIEPLYLPRPPSLTLRRLKMLSSYLYTAVMRMSGTSFGTPRSRKMV